MIKTERFEFDETKIDEAYREKNIAFFRFVSELNYSEAYYVYQRETDSIDQDIISIFPNNLQKPMSIPVKTFGAALGLEDFGRSSLNDPKFLEIMGKNVILKERKDHANLTKERIIRAEKESFWNNIERSKTFFDYIQILKDGKEIVFTREMINESDSVPKFSIRLIDGDFYLISLDTRDLHNFSHSYNFEKGFTYNMKKIPFSNAIERISRYINSNSGIKDEDLGKFMTQSLLKVK
ncbi:hypothetical protein Bp8pS_030 [Bacillus phage vB_BpuM-BpSp]|nr:hypothetical protein Bp8pS_030 [Bacillus phage vB_BpuM-BpSp]